ncbi:4Fe-4S dicluster domain-containing protein [Clostridia bacterium OttesenSCG-928-F22]|nr:4Fe-4S dicluster domain-containing protein [Clostridia bacterium OttesenSCG-928-F22]
MQKMKTAIVNRAQELLQEGTVDRILGLIKGEFIYDVMPAVVTQDTLGLLEHNAFSGANVSKYLIDETKKDGKILAILKPCDTFSFNQLIKENRIDRDKVFVLGVGCNGMIDIDKLRDKGVSAIASVEATADGFVVRSREGEQEFSREDVLLEKCLACKSKEHVAYDEIIELETPAGATENDRFAQVSELEEMTPEERFAFWRNELSRCIRCNACRNVCPACSCLNCVFDNDASGISSKANSDEFEENMFHIIRAFHVAGRCTDCGECSRVCPQGIPLHLLNRKFIKDSNELYGEYQAGADTDSEWPLVHYELDDVEPGESKAQGGKK